MCRTTLLAFAIAAVAIASEAAPQRSPVDQQISQLAELLSDGIADSPPDLRYVAYGKVFGAARNDAVAFFSVEGFHGGNYHAEYLAVFQALEPMNGKVAKPFRLIAVAQIGGRGQRTFDWKSAKLSPGTVSVIGKKWVTADAQCCPSMSISATFRVRGSNVLESR